MALCMMRTKRNARWNKKLQELFQENDKNQSGSISLDQMSDIFRTYKVDLPHAQVQPLVDPAGQIKKNDFIAYCIKVKLLDLAERKTDKDGKTGNGEKEEKLELNKEKKNEAKTSSLLGFMKKKFSSKDLKLQKELDRVEAAFKKMDKDGDGYIDWEEFKQVAGAGVDVEQAERIFSACDQSGDRKISLEEFREMANIKRKEAKEAEKKFKMDLDKVEAAFRKLDKDGDGFIDWDEFKEVSKDLDSEQAKSIFEACDKSGDKKISLEEFRDMASMNMK